MPLTIGKITLFTSLERNIFLLSSISIALFGISVSAIDMNEGKTLCKLGAIFVALLSIYNIFVITDKGLIELGLLEPTIKKLKINSNVKIFNDVESDPSKNTLLKANIIFLNLR